MNTFAKISIKLAALAIVATSSSPAHAYTSDAFIKRTAAFAELANTAYCPDIAHMKELDIDGKLFEREDDWSTTEIHAYRRVAGSTHHLVINFCGTRTNTLSGIGDVLLDLQGATIPKKSRNGWLGGTATNPWGVGGGFEQRVNNYLSHEGSGLRDYLEARNTVGGKTVIHTIGHSLGGVSSQIASYYMAQFLRDKSYQPDKFHIYNFAFNSPQGVGKKFQEAIATEANSGSYLTPYSFVVERDAVSTWATSYMHSAVGPGIGYDAEARFRPLEDRPASIENHLLGEARINQILNANAWPSGVASSMAAKYLPGCI
ncbi:MAG: hypothetical protein AB1Z98_22095 [Nannocystaceae bacterium]